MKKFLSIVLTLGMVCALALPALAAEAPLVEAPLAETDALPAEAPPEEAAEIQKGNGLDSLFRDIEINQWVTGHSKKGAPDWCRFTLAQPGVVSISFRHTPEDSDGSWYVGLGYYNDHMNLGYFTSAVKFNSSAEMTTCDIGLSAGTHALAIETDGSERNYAVKVNYTPNDQWEKEYNSLIPDATPIELNRTLYCSTMNSFDTDYFKFTLQEESDVTLTFNHTPEEVEELGWKVGIGHEKYIMEDQWDKFYDFIPLVSKFVPLNGEASATVHATLAAGTYYIEVNPRPNTPDGRKYNITLNAVTENALVRGFVTRLYDKCLGRQPDASGMNTWVGVLADGSWTAERVAWGFEMCIRDRCSTRACSWAWAEARATITRATRGTRPAICTAWPPPRT